MKPKDLANALKYFSVSTLPCLDGIDLWKGEAREFVLGEQTCHYRAWSGQEISDEYFAIDTETTFIGERLDQGEMPQLVLIQASGKGPDCNFMIHPRDLATFIEKHREHHFVFFNVAFDVPVMLEEQAQRGEQTPIENLWEMVDAGQCHDVMLLDQLVRLGEGRAPFHQRSLADVAADLLGTELEKQDSPREHYEILLTEDYRDIPPEFYEYAARDSRATLLAFEKLWPKAWEIHNAHVRSDSDEADPERATSWAPLTEQIQVRGALALNRMSNEGVKVDCVRLKAIIRQTEEGLKEAIKRFEADESVKTFERMEGARILKHRAKGAVELTQKGGPSKSLKLVRKFFMELCSKHGEQPPRTRKGFVCAARDDYVGMSAYETEAVFEKHFRLQDLVALLTKCKEIQLHITRDGAVHSRYITLKNTGRTSSIAPQIQNLPRQGSIRRCFVPRKGCLFYGVDYSAIELASLASICRHRYGYSKLGDRIVRNEDPHRFTAAQILGKPLEEVTKDERQAAKVVNFGVPGGMGAQALANQARTTYGVEMSEEEAARWKEELIRKVYPEIGEFLDDYLGRFICGILGISEEQIVDDLIELTEADGFSHNARDWILGCCERALRTGQKADGEPYNNGWARKVWEGLRKAYLLSRSVKGKANERIEAALRDEDTGRSIARLFFPTRAVTLTGRVWSDVNYRQAHNAQFQGLAADGAKLALYRLVREGYRPLIFVHDEVILEVRDDHSKEKVAAEIGRVLIEEMAHVISDVSIRVEGKFMQRWEK